MMNQPGRADGGAWLQVLQASHELRRPDIPSVRPGLPDGRSTRDRRKLAKHLQTLKLMAAQARLYDKLVKFRDVLSFLFSLLFVSGVIPTTDVTGARLHPTAEQLIEAISWHPDSGNRQSTTRRSVDAGDELFFDFSIK